MTQFLYVLVAISKTEDNQNIYISHKTVQQQKQEFQQ